MGENSNYDQLIEKVIYKYARRVPWQDKDDLRQEASLALFVNREKINSPRLAYIIIRNTIINALRERPPDMDDITDPGIIKKADQQNICQPTVETLLDAAQASEILDGLTDPYRFIIQATFGLGGLEEHTDAGIGLCYNRDRHWVQRERRKAINLLKGMMV